MKGFICYDCEKAKHSHHVFPLSDAISELVLKCNGGPATIYSCPFCLERNLSEEIFVCPECQREELVKGADLGKKCLQYEQDAKDELAAEDKWRKAS